MRVFQTKFFYLFLCLCTLCFFNSAKSQTKNDATKKYDEIIDLNSLESIKVKKDELDELVLLLPELDSTLYGNWKPVGEPEISKPTDELFSELGIEKSLKQTYQNENHIADVLIYKFVDYTGAYSAYTILHSGATTKLMVGKNASESEKLINFWKGNYFVDIHTMVDNDSAAKEFIILFSQDISKNIQSDQIPPVVAIQLPALSRIQGSEKYCIGEVCCKQSLLKDVLDLNCSLFNIPESGGLITADYQLSDNVKDKERIKLFLTRYIKKESAQAVFNTIKESYEKKKIENKEIDVDFDIEDSILKIKNKKNDYTMLKQKGNLLAIAYGITNKKAGEKILGLIPWPIEISKP